MVTRIQKWGNSLGLRIPKAFAEEANVREGSSVDLCVEGGKLVVRPVRPRRYRLSELLKGIKPGNVHGEIPTGKRRGREVW